MRLTGVDKLRMRSARTHDFGSRWRHAGMDALASWMWTGSDDLRSRRRAGVRPARRNKRLGRRTTSWMLLWRRTPAAAMVLIVLGRSRAGQS
jgi:hypothetical protein